MANTVDIIIKARDDSARAFAQVRSNVDKTSDSLRRMRGPLLAVAAATAGLAIAGVVAGVGSIENRWCPRCRKDVVC